MIDEAHFEVELHIMNVVNRSCHEVGNRELNVESHKLLKQEKLTHCSQK